MIYWKLEIEGQASTVTPKVAAISFLGGILRNRYVVTNDLLGELIRVTVNGANPRPNPIIEILSLPLLSTIFTIWTLVTDYTIKQKISSILNKTKKFTWLF